MYMRDGMHPRGRNDLSMTFAKLGAPKVHFIDFTFFKPPTPASHPQRTGPPKTENGIRQFSGLSEERDVLARQMVMKEMENEARQVGEEDHDLPSVIRSVASSLNVVPQNT